MTSTGLEAAAPRTQDAEGGPTIFDAEEAAPPPSTPGRSSFKVNRSLTRRRSAALETAAFRVRRGRDTLVIDPRTNIFMPYWDIIMVILVAFTATVTPYEVAFFEERNVLRDGVDAMYVINRIVDAMFMFDILLTCNTMYEIEPSLGQPSAGIEHGKWEGRRRRIIWHYMRGPWFVIDLVSVFPFDFYGLSFGGEEATATAAAAEAAVDANSGGLNPTSLRLVKLLRMLKLARMLKAAEYFAPLAKDVIMVRLELTYGALKILELVLWLLLFTHLQACLWGLASSFSDNGVEPTWIREYATSHEAVQGSPPEPWEVYVSAVYWSAMTVTSIGYGEMLPVNSGERVACTFFMLLSGMVWTYILSTAAGIAATLNPNEVSACSRHPATTRDSRSSPLVPVFPIIAHPHAPCSPSSVKSAVKN